VVVFLSIHVVRWGFCRSKDWGSCVSVGEGRPGGVRIFVVVNWNC
jgi:hypothetical protein